MAKVSTSTEQLEEQIAAAARAFAHEVVSAIGNATVSDLMALEGNLFAAAGQDPSTPNSPNSPNSVDTRPAPVRRKRNWPTCCLTDCSNSYYPASGKSHLCYEHFLGNGGKHPSKRR